MPDPKKKPIIVNSKNNPRYRAYQDSLSLYNLTKKQSPYYNEIINNAYNYSTEQIKNILNKAPKMGEKEIQARDRLKAQPISTKEYGTLSDNSNDSYSGKWSKWAKPQQPVIVQQRNIPQVTSLQPMSVGVQNNNQIQTNLNIPIPEQRKPNYYDVKDTNNQKEGGGDTQYRVDNLNDLKELPKEQWTRTTTPHYSLGGNIQNMNRYAEGGTLNQFNVGGTHEQNPLGGIPQGPNATVEQGETSTKTPNGKYIYSNRIAIDENMTKEMNLPSYIKGKTFADASKAIDNKFKDRLDKYSTETKNSFLERLKQAQETVKQQEQQRAEQIAQSMQSNQQEVPDMMNGQIPQGMEEYTEQPEQSEQPEQNKMFMGGEFNLAEAANITGGLSGLAGKASPYLGAASGAMSLGSLAQGHGASTNSVNSALSGAATGAQAGMMFGAAGAGVGAAIGIGAGLIGANKAKKQQTIDLRNSANSANLTDSFAYGGKIKQFRGGGSIPFEDSLDGYEGQNKVNMNYNNIMFKPTNTIPQTGAKNINTVNNNGVEINDLSENNDYSDKSIAPNSNTTNQGIDPNKSTDEDNDQSWLDKNGGKMLKYAPVAMNAYQLSQLKKPQGVVLDKLTNKFKPEYVDEAQLQNITNNEMNNSVNSISELGGSQGAVRNAILGAGLNKSKALSNAYIDASAQNRQMNLAGQQFNLGIDQANINQSNSQLDINSANQAAYRNEKSKYLGAIGTDLGAIGKEEVNKNQLAEGLGYDVDGDYFVNKVTKERIHKDEFAKKMATKEKNTETTKNAYGGYLTMNKIGR